LPPRIGGARSLQTIAAIRKGVVTGERVMAVRNISSPSILVPEPIPPGLSSQDATFLQQAFQANASEIVEANLAVSKSSNPATQQFASWMLGDHTGAEATLGQIAAQLGVTLPGTFTVAQQAEFAQLQSASGPAFDTTYAVGAVKDHQQVLALFQQEATAGQNPAVTTFAQQLVPALQAHLNGAAILATATTGNTLPLVPVAPPSPLPGIGPAFGTPSAQDVAFVRTASLSNMAEVAQGQLAVRQPGNVAGMEFASWMVSDHTGAEAALQSLGVQEGVPVAGGLDQANQQELGILQSLTDGNFFAAYVTSQVVGHTSALSAFIQEAHTGQDPAFTAYAISGIPTLALHLQGAINLERSVPGAQGAASAINAGLTNLLNTAAATGDANLLKDLTAIAATQPGFSFAGPPGVQGSSAFAALDTPAASMPVMMVSN
jgi:putative membrane protein